MRSIFSVLLSLLLVACVHAPPRDPQSTRGRTPLVLVSIDGYRADYLDRGLSPTLRRLADTGVRAQWMNPSYPSLTFPNHYTLVTGLWPDHHGIVSNRFIDARLGTFDYHDRIASDRGGWWGGEPLWMTAREQGLPVATMFWPGSSATIAGQHAQRWYPYDADLPMAERVDRVLGWLREPPRSRPQFITLYFEAVDRAGHDFGPDSPEVDAAITQVDAALRRLVAGIAGNGPDRAVNLVIVSDHGMAAIASNRVSFIDDLVDPRLINVVTSDEFVGINPLAGETDIVERALLGAHPHVECWRRSELPPRWHYGSNPRIPAIICQPQDGWLMMTRAKFAQKLPTFRLGGHGFDPDLRSMHALFVANGPSFGSGVVLAPFDNVDVYPLMARLLGITPRANDGDITPLLPALRDTLEPTQSR